jgi:protein-S-isoprenylcysteine O-methyltransferase Ste14
MDCDFNFMIPKKISFSNEKPAIASFLEVFCKGFRVGIDNEHPDKLITTGVFAFTRNPIYVAFALILLGQFLIFPNWILLIYVGAGVWLFHRQVLRKKNI